MKTKQAALIILMLLMSAQIATADETQAGTTATAVGTTSASTSVSTISNEVGSIASSIAVAIGDVISVFSQSTATGKYVGGFGEVIAEGSETANANTGVSIEPASNSLYMITVTASGSASGDAQGRAWTLAYGGNIPFNDIINPPIPVVQPVAQERSFYGYTFGKCDVQRYKHFWLQLRNNNTEDDARALMHMDIIATGLSNKWGTMAMSELENRYNITDRNPPDELNGNGDKNGRWCKLPS